MNTFREKLTASFEVPLTFPKQELIFTYLQYKSLESTMGKGEIAR